MPLRCASEETMTKIIQEEIKPRGDWGHMPEVLEFPENALNSRLFSL